jgi:HSP20 family protein
MAVPTIFRTAAPFYTGRDPLWEVSRSMDRMLEELSRAEGGGVARFVPRLEVVETENEFIATAELPGLEEKDVHIEVHGSVLTVRGEKKSERTGENEGRTWSERSYGEFRRVIELPSEVHAEKATASFKNGVLTVTLPKSDAARVRNVPITNA